MKPGAIAILAALTLAGALLPQVAAQVPSVPLCGPADVGSDRPHVETSRTAPITMRFRVTNEGRVDGTVSLSFSQPANGWTRTSPEPQPFPLPAGESREVALTLAPPADGTTYSDTEVTASARLDCGPVVGAVNAEPETIHATFDASRTGNGAQAATGGGSDPDAAGQATGLLGPGSFLPFLIVATLVVAAVAGALALRPKATLALVGPGARVSLPPGRGSSVPVDVTNRGTRPARVLLTAEGLPAGWNAFVAIPEFNLAAGETRRVLLLVRPPVEGPFGRAAGFGVQARTRAARPQTANVRIEAELGGPAPANG